jgi:hypothetical protein
MTGTTRGAAVISLPRSQVEMTDWDLQWQERITKVVRRVAKDLIANDEAEIGAGVRRRLFEHLGPERNQKRVAKMFADWCFEQGTLGGDFDRTERAEVLSKVKEAQEEAQEELWASYRYVILADNQEPDGLKVIDLGAGHASASETLCGRVIGALKSQALLNETVGAGYLERRWPPSPEGGQCLATRQPAAEFFEWSAHPVDGSRCRLASQDREIRWSRRLRPRVGAPA